MHLLGISAFYHDAAAALLSDGIIVAAAEEERFTRVKHDASLPVNAIAYCLDAAGVHPGQISAVAFYDKPVTTFARLLATTLQVAPRGFGTFRRAAPEWMRDKLWAHARIEQGLHSLGHPRPPEIHFAEHHMSHAASAFFPSPFDSAAVLTLDGVGEWATSSVGTGRGNHLELHEQMHFPHSLGLLYAAFTEYCGFRVNSGEYKLMGLAAYGEPVYADLILDRLVDLRADGSFRLDLRSFDFLTGDRMVNGRFERLFGGRTRLAESELTERHANVASSIQAVTEEIVLRMGRHAAELTGERDVVLAGGVALNCVANRRLADDGPFDHIWVQPAAGDAGGAIGAAYAVWHQVMGRSRQADPSDSMSGCSLGPRFTAPEVESALRRRGATYLVVDDRAERAKQVAAHLADGGVVALFSGRMEFGPRALGHRSILADPRDPGMRDRVNAKVKRRESFRPFAPAVLEAHAGDWFAPCGPSRHMSRTVQVLGDGLPAVTHVDGSARVQTVRAQEHPELHAILEAFHEATGCPVLVNTSFNVRGEPIVCSPDDAYSCFLDTDIDLLVMENCIVTKDTDPGALV